jgi:hypothetical protein
MLLMSLSASAEPQITTLKKGEIAPFDGTMFNVPAAAQLAIDLEFNERTCQLKIDREVEIAEIHKDIEIAKLQSTIQLRDDQIAIINERYRSEIDYLQNRLEKSERKIGPGVVLAGGIVTGIGLTMTSAWILSKVPQ